MFGLWREPKRTVQDGPTVEPVDRSNRLSWQMVIRSLQALGSAPPRGPLPGQADPAVSPERLKFEYGTFVYGHRELAGEVKAFEMACERGPLAHFFPLWWEWAMEDYFWHGSPESDRHPMDRFIQERGSDYSAPALEQFARLKQAVLGTYKLGRVRGGVVEATPWDLLGNRPAGELRHAVCFSIEGVQQYREGFGCIAFEWLAPWAPEKKIDCFTGFGMVLPPSVAIRGLPILGLCDPEFVSMPMPWHGTRAAQRKLTAKWHQRNWGTWLQERLQFPFQGHVSMPPGTDVPPFLPVHRVIPASLEQIRENGVYLECGERKPGFCIVAGATCILPIDLSSQNTLVLAEYQAYRKLVGIPPGQVGQPQVQTFKPNHMGKRMP